MSADVFMFCTTFTMGTPFIAVLWFLGSLFFYIKCPKEQVEEKKAKRKSMIISGIVAVLLAAAFIWLVIQFSQAIEHM